MSSCSGDAVEIEQQVELQVRGDQRSPAGRRPSWQSIVLRRVEHYAAFGAGGFELVSLVKQRESRGRNFTLKAQSRRTSLNIPSPSLRAPVLPLSLFLCLVPSFTHTNTKKGAQRCRKTPCSAFRTSFALVGTRLLFPTTSTFCFTLLSSKVRRRTSRVTKLGWR